MGSVDIVCALYEKVSAFLRILRAFVPRLSNNLR
jgi:hypothetical protein